MTTKINCTGHVRHMIETHAEYMWAEGMVGEVAKDTLGRHRSKIVLETAEEHDQATEVVKEAHAYNGDDLTERQRDAFQRILSELYTFTE